MQILKPHLRPDPHQKTFALLCDAAYELGRTTVCDNTPVAPQWTGPPPGVVQAQAMLYLSLTATIFSALIAIHVKQWLNHYASVDLQASVVERGRNRQRKFDALATWHFHRVMELPLLLLQAALFLLLCTTFRYLWATNTTLAYYVLGLTFAIVFFFISIATLGRPSGAVRAESPEAAFFVQPPVL